MKSNEWLVNDNFLSKVIFHDKYYFQCLCLAISNFIKNIPIPVITTWDYKYSQIYFIVGQEKKAFKVDVNISYNDYIFLVEQWLINFYPKYRISSEIEVPLSDKEILEKVQQENINLNDAQFLKKKIVVKEKGIIEKAYFKGNPEDTFRININGQLSIRMSGNPNKIYLLSTFFKDLRKIEDDIEKRRFIFENSVEIKKLVNRVKIEELSYLGMQMKNFVEIRIESMKRFYFKKIDVRKWSWGNFILNMETDILEKDILDFLEQKNIKIIR